MIPVPGPSLGVGLPNVLPGSRRTRGCDHRFPRKPEPALGGSLSVTIATTFQKSMDRSQALNLLILGYSYRCDVF